MLSYHDDISKQAYLTSQLTNVYTNDLLERHKLKNQLVLEKIMQVTASGIGSLTNPQKIVNTFNSEKINVDYKTVDAYLRYLQEAFIVEPVYRYDIRGRRYISTTMKYYYSDLGLRNSILGFRQPDDSHLMENLILRKKFKTKLMSKFKIL